MSIQCQHNLPRETCWMCNATTRLANAGITTPTNDDLIKELARQVADLREQLVAARQRHDACAASNRLHTEEKLALQNDLAAARALLGEVREWIPYYRWIPDLRNRIDAALAGEKK